MARSVRVRQEWIGKVKSAVQQHGFPRQKDLAEELNLCLATVSNFLNGKPVDFLNFLTICDRLELDRQAIAAEEDSSTSAVSLEPEDIISEPYLDEITEGFIYVERPPIETLCYEALLQPGVLVRVKAPSLMGKTLLMAKVLAQLAQQNYRPVFLNLHLADGIHFTSLDKFLQWFCISVGQMLGLPNRLADYWDERYSTSKVNCTDYFEQYLLAKVASPLVLCLDEVDRVFPYREIAQDFFSLLRAWHEQAKVRSIWKKLRLVVVHSTEVYIPLNINESPFNVGILVELPEFSAAQVDNLAQQHGLNLTENQVSQLMDRVGGHPYLVEQALAFLKVHPHFSVEQLLNLAATEAGIYSNHLRRYWNYLQQYPELTVAFKKVVNSKSSLRLEPIESYKLQSMGLVHLEGNQVRIRCQMYQDYFSDRLK